MILVLNCGSSSIKFKVFKPVEPLQEVISGKVQEIGEGENSELSIQKNGEVIAEKQQNYPNHKSALLEILTILQQENLQIQAVGHRVVHGGQKLTKPVLLDKERIATIESLIPLAPLHNPANLAGIYATQELLPKAKQVAVFDTGFHSTLPPEAYTYAIDFTLTEKGYRRFGFHGISHEFISLTYKKIREQSQKNFSKDVISCHLGNGASLCAIANGKSIATTMGYTPLEGLVMGTRCGDIDAGLVLAIMRNENIDIDTMDKLLNKKSGLLGISGLDNDMRALQESNCERAKLAIEIFCRRLAEKIASYFILLEKPALVFTAGIGENSALVREKTIHYLKNLGYFLDKQKNENPPENGFLHQAGSLPVLRIRTNEEKQIAYWVYRLC
ncbi:MAG: acetate/propionate family kinase [Candidatus Hydrogenedentota bacterium]|nr:MAG: acetate/propionate family kinase [Candidatus Hydrogenedentota bacterium]